MVPEPGSVVGGHLHHTHAAAFAAFVSEAEQYHRAIIAVRWHANRHRLVLADGQRQRSEGFLRRRIARKQSRRRFC